MKKILFLSLGCILSISGCAVNHLGEGLSAGRNKDYSEMLKHCSKASQQANADSLSFKCKGEAQLNLGQRQEAEESYLTYLGRVPNDLDARFAIINLYFSMGRYSAAQGHLETVLSIQPGHLQGLYFLGETHRLTNNCDAALLAYNKALQINPNYGVADIARSKAEEEICEPKEVELDILPLFEPEAIPRPKPKIIKKKKIQGGGAVLEEGDW
jgi:tetratricopeptide (TPR) repeat protein